MVKAAMSARTAVASLVVSWHTTSEELRDRYWARIGALSPEMAERLVGITWRLGP